MGVKRVGGIEVYRGNTSPQELRMKVFRIKPREELLGKSSTVTFLVLFRIIRTVKSKGFLFPLAPILFPNSLFYTLTELRCLRCWPKASWKCSDIKISFASKVLRLRNMVSFERHVICHVNITFWAMNSKHRGQIFLMSTVHSCIIQDLSVISHGHHCFPKSNQPK